MSVTSLSPNDAVTRGRVTRAVFDIDEPFVLSDPGVSQVRRHAEVSQIAARQKGGNSYWSNYVRLWSSGAWGLMPLQLTPASVQEKTVGAGSVYLPSSVSGTPTDYQIQTAPITLAAKFRRASGTGLTSGTGTNPDGSDLFFRFKVTAGTSWNQSSAVTAESHITALLSTLASVQTLTQPMDILARSFAAQDADRGFCLRFTVPGAKQHSPDLIAIFTFGQYALLLRGDGDGALWMYAPVSVGGSSSWRSVRPIRWSRPAQVAGFAHTIVIFPHMGEHGEKNVSVVSVAMDTASVASATGGSTPSGAKGDSGAFSTTEDLWTFDRTLTGQLDVAFPDQVTTAQRFYLLERRDLRGEWQISRLTYPIGTSSPAGKLIAQPHAPYTRLTLGGIAVGDWSVTKLSREVTGMTITARLQDADTASTTAIDRPQPIFDFYSDGTKTPLLYGYKINLAPITTTSAPGSFTCPLQRPVITAGGPDVRQESARFSVEDLTDAWPRLRNRSRLSVKLTTTYTPPGGTEQTVVLFRGAAFSPKRTRRGVKGTSGGTNAPMGMQGSARAYPSPEWSGYAVSCKGVWERLTATTLRRVVSFEEFIHDTTAPASTDGSVTAWKVTSVIKRLLQVAGFPTSMIRIPDLPIRLNPGVGTFQSDAVLDNSTSIAAKVVELARTYLGRWLAFDANDGTQGKWILIAPPPAGAISPVFRFVRDVPAGTAGSLTLPHALHAYPTGTAPTFERSDSYILSPEKNHIAVYNAFNAAQAGTNLIGNHLYNVLSYPVPGSSVAPDPDSPHYLGHEEMLTIADPALWAGGRPLAYQETQATVNYVLLRAFMATCLARRVQPIHAPLVFIQDAVHGSYRPLRFYDPVYLDGVLWYVRSVNIAYEYDRIQMADYELEQLVPYKPGS
jgi:hypothetical protein